MRGIRRNSTELELLRLATQIVIAEMGSRKFKTDADVDNAIARAYRGLYEAHDRMMSGMKEYKKSRTKK